MAVEPRSINDLPDENLLKILSHFRPYELCLTARVCERWNALSKDVELWKTKSYSCDRTSDFSDVVQVLTVAPALYSLTICERKDVEDIMDIVFDKRVGLRKLNLNYCRTANSNTSLIDNIVALYPDLEALSLEGLSLVHGNSLSPAAYTRIPCLKKISELNLSFCEGLSGKTVCLIAVSCQHLKKLSLDVFSDISEDDVIDVINKLGKQLTTLVLDGYLTDAAYLYLKNCARLQELKISHCSPMTEIGLLEGIGSLQELTSLRLNMGHNLTAQAMSTFLHRPSMTSIVLLDLSGCDTLDDKGLKGIAERCLYLKELAVSQCYNVTDIGISLVITNCTQLRILNLKGLNRITGDGWLALVPSCLPDLRLLYLKRSVRFCDKDIEELMTALPGLVVIKSSGDIVGAVSHDLYEAVYGSKSFDEYFRVRQWALDR